MEIKQLYEGGLYVPLTKTEWIYSGTVPVQQRSCKWMSGKWVALNMIDLEFEGARKKREILYAYPNGFQTAIMSEIYHYQTDKLSRILTYAGRPESGDIIKEINFTYNNVDSLELKELWVFQADANLYITTRLTYNELGMNDSVITKTHDQSGLIEANLSLQFYDNQQRMTVQIQKKLNLFSGRWENKAKTEFEYDSTGRINNEYLYGNSGMFWSPNTRFEYLYDSFENLKQKSVYQAIYRQWRKIFTVDYSNIFNKKPSLMESTYNFWGGNTGDPVTSIIPFYFNDDLVLMRAQKIELKYIYDPTYLSQNHENRLHVYPNPSSGIFYVNTQHQQIESWEVFNLKGMMIKKERNTFHTGMIDLTGLPEGAYLLRVLTADKQVLNQKVTILNH